MTPERWRQIEALFEEACALDGAERDVYLAERCGEDPGLRQAVEEMLAAEERAPRVLTDAAAALPAVTHWFPAPESIAAGAEIGDWRLIEPIGRGGMGQVWRAERIADFRQQAALKIIHAHLATPALIERFRAERQMLAALTHPHIAQVLDGGSTAEGLPFVAMEYVPGEPLDRYVRGRKAGVEERLDLFAQVCDAVAAAHRSLIVHRDIKPANILVAGGQTKLLDFGIAKLLGGEPGQAALTLPGERMFTAEYASPEQVCGGAITTASDVYSLGAVLYELLADRRPFDFCTASMSELVRQVSTVDPPPPR
ncbi:MAG: serine/threonine-protein kinase [Bryobacteraceae bacterium]|nr:serine/threonine-protein kinase [Bryobacteraceae bacterium]